MSRDPTDIAGEEADLAAQDTARRNAALTEEDDYRWLLSTERGRRLAWRILGLTGMNRPSFTGDATTTFFREGERNIGLKLQLGLANADKQAFSTMMLEHFSQ